ncbi:hypothetical protein NBRC116598_32230 [Pseudophaeobacter arcticus]|uniref:Uncharacterized protein n=1 Tax=Pseudophaeobacter arcticus TaxID=385492 RepID=A0ABQ0APG9_9RHOB
MVKAANVATPINAKAIGTRIANNTSIRPKASNPIVAGSIKSIPEIEVFYAARRPSLPTRKGDSSHPAQWPVGSK